ncbi:MAG: glycosyltransferase family 2 protein [Polaromonas sp.]|uniref:glycosyltransferase family 2 protein n=1 Tax=Polaromonas sp. TaxID=1869339 RepID=UPI00271A12FD|nr:glycosyltransferase family 2 protein [Polaromonas sp.]MDO9112346.1 glycosyltransferase family 2 protein [Polaromonas sp.]MDP1887776.1 glycosyltransferase family 2 protein [Polaromonas sp.]
MKLSIVATLYQSAQYVETFCERVAASARQLAGDSYEIILVNDGSPDNSLDIAVRLTEADSHIVVVDLSRNFGHHNAMMVGLEQSTGDKVFLIDSDLEEEPEWLISFAEQMAAEKADVVYGVQKQRKGGWFERWSGSLFYTLFNWLSDIDHPRNVLTVRLMSRRYVNALLTHREREMVISCLWVITGFRQRAQAVTKHMTSATTYSFIKKLNHLVNAITSFSAAPLKMIFVCGVLVFCGAMTYALFLVVMRFFLSQAVDGYTSIMVSIWVLGGMIISFLGIIGIYLAKIFSETKQRPSAIIRDIYGQSRQ